MAVVVVIIAIIASMLLPYYGGMQARAEESKCLANIRNLYVAASGYMNSNGSWPQIPVQQSTDEPHVFARAWVDALKPFGASHSTWICPTFHRMFQITMDDLEKEENYRIDFVAAPFDDNPASPHLSPRHPWFVEKVASHGRGQLIIMADGTTTALLDVVKSLSDSK